MQAAYARQRRTQHNQAVLQALAKLTQKRLRCAFKAWRQATLRRRHNRVALQGALARIPKQTLRKAFTRWREYAKDKASQRAKVSAFQQRLSKKTLSAALTAWLEGARHCVFMRACLQVSSHADSWVASRSEVQRSGNAGMPFVTSYALLAKPPVGAIGTSGLDVTHNTSHMLQAAC